MVLALRPQHLALAAVSAMLGMLLTAALLLFSQRRTAVAFDCSGKRDGEPMVPELVIQSGPDFLLASPSVSESVNSHLVSTDLPTASLLPARWRFQGGQVLSADSAGFRLRTGVDTGSVTLSFNSAEARWSSGPSAPGQGSAKQPDTVRQCRRLPAVPTSISALNGAPLEYLLLRPWPLAALNPSLQQADLRLALARVLAGRKGSDYSYYKLIAPLPRTALTSADDERLQSARRTLLAELSSTEHFWEYEGSSSATWEFANERQEAERHAADWCSQQSEGNLRDRLASGYQLVRSTPQSKESGERKALYPDGRFLGYVNYTASCQGHLITVRREGDLSKLP
ncbi:MAG: hypothetical protein ACKO0M_08545 [Cyanobium sp.]